MTRDEAKELLLLHSFSHPSAPHHPKAAGGFLGSLRPYRGNLDPANLHEVIAALVTLAPEFEQPTLDREIVAALWSINHLARAAAVVSASQSLFELAATSQENSAIPATGGQPADCPR